MGGKDLLFSPLTLPARVEEVLAQVAAKDPLLEDARLLQLPPGWPRQDETPKKRTNPKTKPFGESTGLENGKQSARTWPSLSIL